MSLSSNDGVVMGIVFGVAFVKAWFKGEIERAGWASVCLFPTRPSCLRLCFGRG